MESRNIGSLIGALGHFQSAMMFFAEGQRSDTAARAALKTVRDLTDTARAAHAAGEPIDQVLFEICSACSSIVENHCYAGERYLGLVQAIGAVRQALEPINAAAPDMATKELQ